MPSNLIVRPGGVGARVTLSGRQTWLGTFPTPEAAREAIDAARREHRRKLGTAASPPKKRRRPRRRPPSMEVCARIAGQLPTTLEVFALVALWSGLRLSEVAALEARDVSFRLGGTAVLHVRHGKGPAPDGKEGWSLLYAPGADVLRVHLVRLPSGGAVGRGTACGACLHQWAIHGMSGTCMIDSCSCRSFVAPMLRNRSGRVWDRKSVNKAWVRARAKVPGCGAVTFHTLRKAHATWLLDNGASDLDVAVQLRHIDWQGRPDPSLVRAVYGFPAVDAALERLAAIS